jgi:hypothetical protein
MKQPARVWATVAALLALAVLVFGSGTAAEKKDPTKDELVKLTSLIEKGNEADAQKQAKAIAGSIDDLDKVMKYFKVRGAKGKGFGVGPDRDKIKPDGIELMLLALARKAPSKTQVDKEADALAEVGYHAAAIASVAEQKAPTHPKKADWIQWAKDLKKASLDLAKAAKAKDADGIKAAAMKANASCASCHMIFRKDE